MWGGEHEGSCFLLPEDDLFHPHSHSRLTHDNNQDHLTFRNITGPGRLLRKHFSDRLYSEEKEVDRLDPYCQ
jgi:hypothetical protein